MLTAETEGFALNEVRVDKIGIANIERFAQAPRYHPRISCRTRFVVVSSAIRARHLPN